MNAIEVNEIKSVLGFNHQGTNEELDEIIKKCQSQSEDFLSRVVFVMTNYKGDKDNERKDRDEGGKGSGSEMFIQFTEDCNVQDVPKVQLKQRGFKSNFLSSYYELNHDNGHNANTGFSVTFSSEYNSMIKDKFKEDVKEESESANVNIVEVKEQKPKGIECEIEKIEAKNNYQKRQFTKKNPKQKKVKNQPNLSQQCYPNQGVIEQELIDQSQSQNQSQVHSQDTHQQQQQQHQNHRKAKKNNKKNKGNANYNNSNNNY